MVNEILPAPLRFASRHGDTASRFRQAASMGQLELREQAEFQKIRDISVLRILLKVTIWYPIWNRFVNLKPAEFRAFPKSSASRFTSADYGIFRIEVMLTATC